MTKFEKLSKVKIYSETVNYLGDVTDTIEIAAFRNFNWASPFIDYLVDKLKDLGDDAYYRIRLGNCNTAIITKDSTAESVYDDLTKCFG